MAFPTFAQVSLGHRVTWKCLNLTAESFPTSLIAELWLSILFDRHLAPQATSGSSNVDACKPPSTRKFDSRDSMSSFNLVPGE